MPGQSKTPQQIRNERANKEAQAIPGAAAAPFVLPIKGLIKAVQNAPPVDPELGTAPDPNVIDTDIPLMATPQPPKWTMRGPGPATTLMGSNGMPPEDIPNINTGDNSSGITPPPAPSPRYRPDSSQSMASLRGLAGSSYSPEFDSSLRDPSVQRYLGFQDRRGELEDQIANQTKARGYALSSSRPEEANAYQGNIDAFKGLLGNINSDIEESPITQGIGEADKYGQAERGAILQGFTGGQQQGQPYLNPIQEQNRYAQASEAAKINAPIEAQKTAGQYNLAQEQEKSRGALAVQQSRGAQAESALNAFLGANQAGVNTNNIRSFNPQTGALTMAPDAGPGNGLLTKLTDARNAYEQTKAANSGWWSAGLGGGTKVEAARQAYMQAAGQVFGRFQASDRVKHFAADILTDPELSQHNLEDLEITNEDGSPANLSAVELSQLQQLLDYTRGLVGGGQ